jgi:hypothetical protein
VSVDLSRLPERVTVRVGERVLVELPSYAGSGNHWSVVPPADGEGARVSVGPEPAAPPPPPAAPEGPPPSATPVPERAVIEGHSPGVSSWRLVLARQFGDRTPVAEHELEVVVVQARS